MPLPCTLTPAAEYAQKGLSIVFGRFTWDGGLFEWVTHSGEPFVSQDSASIGEVNWVVQRGDGFFEIFLPGGSNLRLLTFKATLVDPTALIDYTTSEIDEPGRMVAIKFFDRDTFGVATDPTDGATLFLSFVLTSDTVS